MNTRNGLRPVLTKNKLMLTKTIDRRFLVETLENLLSDEFDSSELVYETESELIHRIIAAAEYYKNNS